MTPPKASPPNSRALAPFISEILSAELMSMFGACSIPHSWSCNRTLFVIIKTLLLCKPLITGFTIEFPVLIEEIPGISLMASPKLKELYRSNTSLLMTDSCAVLLFLFTLDVTFTSINSSIWCSSLISINDFLLRLIVTVFESQETCETDTLKFTVQMLLKTKFPRSSEMAYRLEPSILMYAPSIGVPSWKSLMIPWNFKLQFWLIVTFIKHKKRQVK